MKKLSFGGKHIFILFCFLLCSRWLSAQTEVQIKGKVTEKSGLPLPGVSIVEKGTVNGTISSIDGTYTLKVKNQNTSLIFSYIGFLTAEESVKGKSEINILLIESAASLDEVVVIGYGTVKKGDVTGAITVVNTKALKNTPAIGALGALQGKASGVRVVSNSGQPGAEPTVLVRGLNSVNASSTPLYVVDGMPVSSINFLNPSDIASIDVLKDASSAAIYGSRGSSGVILITTTRGTMSSEPVNNIRFDTYVGMVRPGNSPNFFDAAQYLDYRQRQDKADNTANSQFANIDSLLNNVELVTGSRAGTNWWNEVMNKTARVQNYNLALDGGNKGLAYSTSLNYMSQDGIVQTSNLTKWSWKLNTDIKVSKRIKVSTNLIISEQKRTALGETGNGTYGILSSVYGTDPCGPVFRDPDNPASDDVIMFGYDPANKYSYYYPAQYSGSSNPMLDIAKGADNYSKNANLIAGLVADIQIVKGLSFNSSFSMDRQNGTYFGFSPLYSIATNNQSTLTSLGQNYSINTSWIWNNILNYKIEKGKHELSLLAGYSSEKGNWEYIDGQKSDPLNFNQEEYRVLTMLSNTGSLTSNYGSNTLISYLGRAIYSYSNRYILNFTIRRDGSSKFNPDQRWGTFPSVSMAWKFADEQFVKNLGLKWLSFGKIFVGWGQLGNQNIAGNLTATQYVKNPETKLLFGTGSGNEVIGIAAGTIGNPLLRWETAEQLNIGIDVGLFQNQLFVTAEYYNKQNKDLLFKVAAPGFAGWANEPPYSNIGVMLNKGIDLQVTYKKKIRDFNFEASANLDKYRNEITDLAWMENISAGSWRGTEISRIEEGKPVGFYYGYVCEGVFQNEQQILDHPMSNGRVGLKPGDLIFKDINNDSLVNDQDRQMIGSPHPSFSYGFNFSASYKSIDLSLFFQGTYGNDIYDYTGLENNADILTKAWRAPGTLSDDDPGNPTNDMYRISKTSVMNDQINSLWVKDGSYLRLKTLQIGYSFPQKWNAKLHVKNFRVYASGYNLLTFTKFEGLDPEIGQTYSNPSGSLMGVNIYNYPQSKTISIGCNLNF